MNIGIDLGGSHIKAAVVSHEGEIIHHVSEPTYVEQGFEAILSSLKRIISSLLSEFPEITSVGIGVPGVVSDDGVVRVAPNFPDWKDIPVRAYLQQNFPLPIALDNDANVAALAEAEVGAGAQVSDFLFITLGTGVGGCIISGGTIFRGERGGAGEIGHVIIHETAIAPTGKPSYRAGALEEYVGRLGIIELAKQYAQEFPHSTLHSVEDLDVHHISAAVESGDEAAIACFRRTGQLLGAALTSAMNLLDIRIVIVGGGISQAHPLLLQSTLDTIRLRALPTIADEAEIRLAHFSHTAGVIGAAMLAKKLTKTQVK
ncbi:MAG: ROK family protein [Ignavibacteria bacterium]|nr:ROK family protein [Ignavibacteria bacterium]